MTATGFGRSIQSGRAWVRYVVAHPALVPAASLGLLVTGLATGHPTVALVAAGAGAGATLSGSV
jgi:hypothetical protein